MKKAAFLLIILLLFTGCSSKVETQKITGTMEEIAESYVKDLENQDTEKLLNNYYYTDEMEKALNETVFNQIFIDLESKFGKWIETGALSIVEKEAYSILTYRVTMKKNNINMNIVFDKDKNIAGLNYLPVLEEAISETEIKELEISFGNEPFILSGTLTIPKGDGPFPAVVLVHGSGPSDRDETVLENKPFRDIATYLTDNGIAVLRYDKRTFTYTKEIDIEHFTPYEETVEDAVLAYEYLSNNSYVSSENIYIIGHSFGGYLMPKIAKLTPNAAGYVLISAPVTPIEDLIVTQFEYIFNLDNVVSEEEQSLLTTYKTYQENIHNINLESTLQHTELMGISKEYWLYLQSYTPQTEAKNINKPLLILNGERDYQVPITEFNNWKASLENNDNVTFISYPGLNHLLYLGEGTPSPDEYYTPGHVSKDLLIDVAEWIISN